HLQRLARRPQRGRAVGRVVERRVDARRALVGGQGKPGGGGRCADRHQAALSWAGMVACSARRAVSSAWDGDESTSSESDTARSQPVLATTSATSTPGKTPV